MKLQPKRYSYKKIFKMRFRRKILVPAFMYGDIGLVLSHPLQLTSNRLGKMKLRLKKANRRQITTYRRCWLRGFPQLPLTRKSTNARMGKGRGKLKTWYAMLYSGTILIELRNLRLGRAMAFLNKFRGGLRASDFILFNQPRQLSFPLKRGLTKPILPFH